MKVIILEDMKVIVVKLEMRFLFWIEISPIDNITLSQTVEC